MSTRKATFHIQHQRACPSLQQYIAEKTGHLDLTNDRSTSHPLDAY